VDTARCLYGGTKRPQSTIHIRHVYNVAVSHAYKSFGYVTHVSSTIRTVTSTRLCRHAYNFLTTAIL